jgi:ADP-ribose pyrophosphatase YjhB (NUDIX family)
MLAIRRRDNGTWEPPGGVLELNESPEEGVVREVLEETGIHVEVEKLTGVYKNMVRGVVALVFRCKPSGGEERLTSEAIAVEWFTPIEAKQRMPEVYAIRLIDALSKNTTHVRTHNGRQIT